jgi:hypothetical protein
MPAHADFVCALPTGAIARADTAIGHQIALQPIWDAE